MALYTLIFEYREGSYIDQVEATNEVEAYRIWAKGLDSKPIQYFGEKLKMKLIDDSKHQDYEPTAINNVKNVWCVYTSPSGLVNIIKTRN